MKLRLAEKLAALRQNLDCGHFILADAKDADMAWGVTSPGEPYPAKPSGPRYRSMPEFREQIREIVRQGAVDIMLASVSTMDQLAHREGLFDDSDVTPAIRANDATDVWIPRGGNYRATPSHPFASCYLEEAQYGSLMAAGEGEPKVNLGLYSATFNNSFDSDYATLEAFRAFRADAVDVRREDFQEVMEAALLGVGPEGAKSFERGVVAVE